MVDLCSLMYLVIEYAIIVILWCGIFIEDVKCNSHRDLTASEVSANCTRGVQ